MTEIMGWACLVFLNDSEAGAGIFMDRGHGMCELFDEYKANDETNPRQQGSDRPRLQMPSHGQPQR